MCTDVSVDSTLVRRFERAFESPPGAVGWIGAYGAPARRWNMTAGLG
jgi:hypothetical protein